jgi:hypothetical protein
MFRFTIRDVLWLPVAFWPDRDLSRSLWSPDLAGGRMIGMDVNPYKSPACVTRAKPNRVPLSGGRLLGAVAAVGASTIAGFPIGVMSGIAVLIALPRESRPSCGNSVTDPLAFLGAGVGLICGLVFGWRILFRRPTNTTPIDEQ